MILGNSNLMEPTDYRDDWTVTGDLRGGIFENEESNYDVEEILFKHKVLRKNTKTDSEYSQFWAYFSTKTSAENFIKRFNKLVERFTL